MKRRKISPVSALYLAFIQGAAKTPRNIQKALTKLEEFGQSLTDKQHSRLEDLTGTLYDQAEERGFRHGFFAAMEMWEEYFRSK